MNFIAIILKKAMAGHGLGTPATRASIIEKIIATGYVTRKGKSLMATATAYELIDILPDELKNPVMTARWEKTLEDIYKNGFDPKVFMSAIECLVTDIVDSRKELPVFQSRKGGPVGVCPRCGLTVYESAKTFSCESGKDGCNFALWKESPLLKYSKKEITAAMAKQLLSTGRVKITGLKSKKTEKKYNATLILADDGKFVGTTFEFEKR